MVVGGLPLWLEVVLLDRLGITRGWLLLLGGIIVGGVVVRGILSELRWLLFLVVEVVGLGLRWQLRLLAG